MPATHEHCLPWPVPYAYALRDGAALGDFNMEAQGDVLADYFALKFLRQPGVMRQPQYANALALYESVLARFRATPADRRNLPARRVWRSVKMADSF